MIGPLLNTTADIKRRAAGDDNSGAFATLSGQSAVACRVVRVTGGEAGEFGDTATRKCRVMFAAGVTIAERDRMTIDGVEWDVESVSAAPGGVAGHHVEVDARANR
jgi:hypothetical protein